jgi:ankyrin repeat protein
MKHIFFLITAVTILTGCRATQSESVDPPGISIHKAASTANLAALKLHLDAGTDPNLKAPSLGVTPLALASGIEAVALLLKNGADVNDIGIEGNALHWHRSPEIMPSLIRHGADVNAVDGYGNTPLHGALSSFLRSSTKKTVELLLAAGADVNIKNNGGLTPLDVYLKSGHSYLKSKKMKNDLLKLLLSNGAENTLMNGDSELDRQEEILRSGDIFLDEA